jgi:DNA-binding transcriptional LysR family regulator
VAFAYWIDPTTILAAIRSFNAHNPAIPVDLQAMNVPHQIVALRDERLDVGFVRPPIAESSLHSETFVREPFVVALPASHRLAARERVSLSSLTDESFVLSRRETVPIFYDLVLRVCRDAGFVPRAPHEADHPQMVLGLVAAGMGVSLVPASMRNARPHGVVLRSLRQASNVLQTGIAWRREDPSPIVAGFVQIVREVTTVGSSSRKTGSRRHSIAGGKGTLKVPSP